MDLMISVESTEAMAKETTTQQIKMTEVHEIEEDGSRSSKYDIDDELFMHGKILDQFDNDDDDDDDDEYAMRLQLHKAATKGTVEHFQQVLEKFSAQRNESSPAIVARAKLSEMSLLHAAVNCGNEDLATFLAEHFPSLKLHENRQGDSILHIAARCGMRRIVQVFVESQIQHSEEADGFLVKQNKKGNTALHEAVMAGDFEVAKLLISKIPNPVCCVNEQGWSALRLAIQSGESRIFEIMLDSICHDRDLLQRFRKEAEPLAHAAVLESQTGMLELMAKKGRQLLKMKDENGRTPLHYAAKKGNIDAVNLLLSHSITSCYQMDLRGFLPIHLASRRGHVKVIKVLLEYCGDPMLLLTEDGRNILHMAAGKGKDDTVRYILKNPTLRKLLNEKDNAGNTPLHLAAKKCRSSVVLALTWDKEVELNAINGKCSTPLDVFCESKMGEYLDHHLLEQEITFAALASAGCEAKSNNSINVKSTSGKQKSDKNAKDSKKPKGIKWMNDHIGSLLTIATLVATGTFTVGFTVPGGLISSGETNEGIPTFLNNHTFQFFMICNNIAFFCSIICIISCFYTKYPEIIVAARAYYVAVMLFGLSILMMSLAFTAAIQLAISSITWLAYTVLFTSIIFLVIMFLAWVLGVFPFHWRNPLLRFVSYYLLRICIFVFLGKR